MKTCTTCNLEKERSAFHKRKISPDGLSYKCKSCVKNTTTAYSKKPKKPKESPASGETKYRVATSKTCTACNIDKPIEGFCADKTKPDGHAGWCRDCSNAAAAKRSKKLKEAAKADTLWTPRTEPKICSMCKIEKDVSSFYKDSTKKDRLASRCQACDDLKYRDKSAYAEYQHILDTEEDFIRSVFYPED